MAWRRKRRGGFRKRSAGPRKGVRRAVRKAAVQVMNRRIRQVVTRMAEKKTITYNVNTFDPLVMRTGTASSAANVFSMTPYTGAYTISQGSGQGQRQGNKIRIHSAILNIDMIPNPYNAVNNPYPTPCFVRIWFVTSKIYPADIVPAAQVYGGTSSFFQNGSTFNGMAGTFQDLQLHVNKDSLIYRGHRTYKIGPAVYTDVTGGQPTYANMANNDFKFCVLSRIDLTRMMPKVWTFDDTVVNPTSTNVTMVIQPIFATGGVPASNTAPIAMKFALNITYTDF